MRAVDLLLFGALLVFAVSGFAVRSGRHALFRLACLAVACAAGIAALALFHWQAAPALALAISLLVGTAVRRWASRPAAAGPLRSRGVRPRIAGVVLLVAIAACALPYWAYPLLSFPAADGPFGVGVRDFDLTRPSGSRAGRADRQLRVRVWYPAQSTEGRPRSRYFSREEALEQLPNYQYLHLFDVRTSARVGATPRADGGPWPVVIFNHGYMSYIAQNTALAEHLASHGYVVFSVSHPHDGVSYRTVAGVRVESHPWRPSEPLVESLQRFIGDPTYEGRYAGYEAFRRAISQDRLARSVRDWRDDDLYLAGHLAPAAAPAAIADIAALIDTEARAYAGMSFGGGTAATVCQADPGCKAAVSLDGVNWDLSLFDADLRTPLLFLQSDWLTHPLFPYQPREATTNPQDLAYERWEDAGLRRDVYRYRVERSAHIGMMDLTLLARAPWRHKPFGEIDGRRTVDLMNEFTLAFLERYLRGVSSGFPANVEARFPEARPHRASGVRVWWRSRKG